MNYRTLNQQYFELLKTKINYETGLVEDCGIKSTQEKIELFLINAKIFEKGVKSFTGLPTFF